MQIRWRNNNVEQYLDIIPSDESERTMAIMEPSVLTLHFSLPEFIEIPEGAHCTFEGHRYELLRPMVFVKNGNRKWDYTLTMESPDGYLSRWKVRNTTDGSLEFPFTATPTQHIELLVAILNTHSVEDGTRWRVGTCLSAAEKLINYNHTQLNDALAELAALFETEFEITTESEGSINYATIHLGKVEHFKDTPIAMSYGREGGFMAGIRRENADEHSVARLFVQGTEENITAAKYNPLDREVGSRRLLLPLSQELGYDGNVYSDEVGYSKSAGRMFKTSADGQSVTLASEENTFGNENSLDCTDIIPSKEVVVIGVEKEEAIDDNGEPYHNYDLILDIPENENYQDYSVDGEVAYIVFQSGVLAGREFDINTDINGKLDIEKVENNGAFSGWRFKVVGGEQDGFYMPSETWAPKVGDTIKVFGIQLPKSYICNDNSRSGASWDMFREAIRVMWERSTTATYYEGEISPIWVARNWAKVGAKVRSGGYIRLSDPAFDKKGSLIRIVSVKTFINNSHAPQITLSNEVVSVGFKSTIAQIKGEEVKVEGATKDVLNFTRRRFRDAKQSQNMLAESLRSDFTESISPVAVNTMQAIFGATSLQYTFVNSLSDMTPKSYLPTINNETIVCNTAYIKHETLGITEVKPERDYTEYKRWLVTKTALSFSDPDKAYYLYIRASQTSQIASFKLSAEPIELGAEVGFYHFLLATIGKLSDGVRSYQSWNGFTEITPAAIRANRLVSTDGEQYIDFEQKTFRVGNTDKFVRYENGELEVSGALIGESVLGREIKVLDGEGQVSAGISGIENQPLIYGAMQTTIMYEWTDNPDDIAGSDIYYTRISPSAIIKDSVIDVYGRHTDTTPHLQGICYAEGVLNIGSTIIVATGKVRVANSEVEKARFQLLSNGTQIFGDPKGKRIEVQPNQDTATITVFDENGNQTTTISGDTYDNINSLIPQSEEFAIPTFGMVVSEGIRVGNHTSRTIQWDVTTKQAGHIIFPPLVVRHQFNTTGFSSEGEESVQIQLMLKVDGRAVRFFENYDNLNAYGISTPQDKTTTEFALPITTGRHTLELEITTNFINQANGVDIKTWTQVYPTDKARIEYPSYMATVFGNGLMVSNSSLQYFAAIKEGESMRVRAIAAGYGFDVDSSGLRMQIGGKWYKLGVSGNTLTLTSTTIE